jgi:hypothetical protein
MAHQVPNEIPTKLISGDTFKWDIDLSDYPASEGWTLTYECRGPQALATITATNTGDTYNISVPATTTDDWDPGFYYYQAYVTLSDERYSVDSSFFQVVDNLSALSGAYDGRSDIKTALDALDASIAGSAGKDQLQMQIAGQMITRMTPQQRIFLRDWLRSQYQTELDEIARAQGKKNSRIVRPRFV